MYPRNFLCEEAKIKQRTPLKKELCEIGEEAIWESLFTSFFIFYFSEQLDCKSFYKNSFYKNLETRWVSISKNIPVPI